MLVTNSTFYGAVLFSATNIVEKLRKICIIYLCSINEQLQEGNMKQTPKDEKNVLIWGEHINIKDFVIGIIIQLLFLIVALLIPVKSDLKLVIGLVAIVLGFTVNTIWIKPKRNLEVVEEQKDDI